MPWDLVITKPAVRDLRRLPRNDLLRLNASFEAMRQNPYAGDIKFLAGTGGTLRRRIGVWRVFFEVYQQQHKVVILGVKRRTSTTY
jgi:mRNA-degrading endonuclease RelE of RelBE toxin-antitoxin system